MNPFEWRAGRLHADEIPVEAIAAATGTPTYIYSATAIRAAYQRLADGFAPIHAHLHYAVKACPNTNLLKLLRSLGAGMDVVSGGEMERAWLAGTPMSEIVFAGVGKTEAEVRAALDGRFSPVRADAARFGAPDPADRGPVGIINIESESELARVAAIASELGTKARFCLRVNPNVDPKTHEYTTTGKKENKFGIDAIEIAAVLDRWRGNPGLEFQGLHVHIGSPVPEVAPFVEAVGVMLELIDQLAARGHNTSTFDLGGGWPVPCRRSRPTPKRSCRCSPSAAAPDCRSCSSPGARSSPTRACWWPACSTSSAVGPRPSSCATPACRRSSDRRSIAPSTSSGRSPGRGLRRAGWRSPICRGS
jgi:diaminopimelate decarboxylase